MGDNNRGWHAITPEERDQICGRVAVAMAQGKTLSEAARDAGVDRVTLWRWRTSDPHVRALLEGVEEQLNECAENALLSRVLGYEYEEQDVTRKRHPDGSQTVVNRAIRRRVVPDVKALELWLTRRCPERWPARVDGDDQSDEDRARAVHELLRELREASRPAPPAAEGAAE